MEIEMLQLETSEAMDKTLNYLLHEFSGVRTGKASPALVENIDVKVQSYGSVMKLKQLALITTPEPRLIVIQPFDPSTATDIERGIRESKLGINPSIDGKIVRLPIPELSQERRKDLVKLIKKMAEDARVKVRHSRREAIDKLKKAQKDSEITEDQQRDAESEIQKITDDHINKVNEMVEGKEKDIMTV